MVDIAVTLSPKPSTYKSGCTKKRLTLKSQSEEARFR